MNHRIPRVVWLMIPVVMLAFHAGPGQRGMARDRAARQAGAAHASALQGRWQEAVSLYDQALAALPERDITPRIEWSLARADARIHGGALPEAIQDLERLLSEVSTAGGGNHPLVPAVRSALASARYYAAWLMRLEGAPPEEWMESAEGARQGFRLLAEQVSDPAQAGDYQKNLEAVIRLERMDLSELQGLALPKKCDQCQNCSQKSRKQRESRKESKPAGEKPQDARKAGQGTRPEESGS